MQNESKRPKTIAFSPITPQDKPTLERFLYQEPERGCEFSFANLCLWGQQNYAVTGGQLVLFSHFDDIDVYTYPFGDGDKKPVLDAILADAAAQEIPCRITGLTDASRETLTALYPGKFRIHDDDSAYNYVYAIDDLADLKGKKYHGKRNHLHRFAEAHPDYRVEPLEAQHRSDVLALVERWYADRPDAEDADSQMEQTAILRAMDNLSALEMEGLVLLDGGEVLAVTFASRMSSDTFDVHFEKARADVNGAYTAINREFARYIREKYPDIRFLNREEDLGIDGLRQAKQSYHPHHMVKIYWASLTEDENED